MKTSAFLSIALLGTIILCYYLYSELEKIKLEIVTDTCRTTAGFEAPIDIPPSDTGFYANQYRGTLVDPDSITGGIISRAAFDSLLCDPDVNAISYTLARRGRGTFGPGGNGVFMFFTGVHVHYDASSSTIERVDRLDLPLYTLQHWCPPTCVPR